MHPYQVGQQRGAGFWNEATALIPWRVGADPVYPDPLQQGAYDAGVSAGRAQAFPVGWVVGGGVTAAVFMIILYMNRGKVLV